MSGNLVTTAGLLLILLGANAAYPSGQVGKNSRAEAVVREIMAADISRCHSSVNGVKMISFVPPTDAEFAQIRYPFPTGRNCRMAGPHRIQRSMYKNEQEFNANGVPRTRDFEETNGEDDRIHH